ncbi:methylmalonyl-CoA mutase [Kaistia sp. 32K]|uniref:methylmalonyl-CoA mutase family protein n=1 Tax=Kaistia sp. 32K TaxID=2795690 RepID=UPI001915FD70|nr:methylmalonyl-CoA mutase family protein [Kaistia sp. 32K]BCP51664.1 methylmalonyl-CoA mutase [Kaistia sp. 32K]
MTRTHAEAAFRAASDAEWHQLAVKALKGADFEAKLVSRTLDDIRIEPLYAKAAGDHARPARSGPGAWRVVQRIDHSDPDMARTQALDDLDHGASGLALVFADAPSARGFGLADASALARALDGVMIDLISLRLETGANAVAVARGLLDLVRGQGLDLDSLDLDFGLDPFSALARAGDAGVVEPMLDGAAELAGRFGLDTASRVLRADGRVWHEAGASEAQELALTLAAGVASLRGLERRGLSLDLARRRLGFLLAVDADEFLGIAKFRALRRLWARVEAACGLDPRAIRLDAETSFRMTTRRDPHVNLLRSTVAAFSAGLGGADSVAVLPFTIALGLPDADARRIARNTQTILLEESGLGHVVDPAGGAGGFEALTDALCEKAWVLFQTIEAAGGLVGALESGWVGREIAAVADKREREVRRRKLPITGTSAYPDLAETPPPVLAPRREEANATPGLATRRTAEPFERLRDRAEAITARRGRRPQIFLANLGTPAAFGARAGFAKDLFEASGIAAPMNDGFATVDDLVEAAVTSGADAVCLCSSDEVYERETGHAVYEGETLVEEVARRLVAAGITHVVLAGRPGERETAYRHAGVEAFIFVGCDALDYPGRILDRLDEALR